MKKVSNLLFLIIVVASIVNLGCSKSYIPAKIEGTAMLPSLKDGDKVLVEENVSEIKRGEVIFFHYPKDTTRLYFKRVVGLPNETISILNGKVFINDLELDEPYLDQTYNQAKSNRPPIKVPARSYFVLGDNRDNSSDSRYWGTVKEELIVGRYYFTYWNSK